MFLPGIADGGQFGTGTISLPVYAIALGETHVFTPTFTNEAHVGWNHNVQSQLSSNAADMGIPEQYGIAGVPQVTDNGGLPNFGFGSGLTSLGPSPFMPTLGTITSLEIMDNVTKIYGSHTFKAGFQFDRLYGIVFQPPLRPRAIRLLRTVQRRSERKHESSEYGGSAHHPHRNHCSKWHQWCRQSQRLSRLPTSRPNRDMRYYSGIYFQDDWKVTPTLTVNLGLRWDHFTPYAEINGRQANLVQSDGGNGSAGTLYIPNKGCSVPRAPSFDALLAANNITLDCTSNLATGNAQNKNFAPRIGFANRITPLMGGSRWIWHRVWGAGEYWLRAEHRK